MPTRVWSPGRSSSSTGSTCWRPDPGMRVTGSEGVDLRRTLDSGQAFRWRWAGPVAEGVVGRRVVRLAQDVRGIRLLSPGTSDVRAAIRRYLGVVPVDGHPRRVEARLASDPVFARVPPYT